MMAKDETPKTEHGPEEELSAGTEESTVEAAGPAPDAEGVDALITEMQDAHAEEQSDPQSELKRLEQELAAANDQALRAHAELENFRKRTYRQMEDERKYAGLPLIRDLLSVVDNLERAIQSAEQNENSSSLLDGVKMVAQQFSMVLEQHHCKRIDATGEAFDPHLHEAIAQQPSEEHPEGNVMDVAQIGYQLHDRVVRPTQVLVSTGPAGKDDESEDVEEAQAREGGPSD